MNSTFEGFAQWSYKQASWLSLFNLSLDILEALIAYIVTIKVFTHGEVYIHAVSRVNLTTRDVWDIRVMLVFWSIIFTTDIVAGVLLLVGIYQEKVGFVAAYIIYEVTLWLIKFAFGITNSISAYRVHSRAFFVLLATTLLNAVFVPFMIWIAYIYYQQLAPESYHFLPKHKQR